MSKSRNSLLVAGLLSMTLVTACSFPNPFSSAAEEPSTPETKEQPQQESPVANGNNTDAALLATLPEELVLGPGGEYEVAVAGVQITSTESDSISAKDGRITVSSDAATGDMATLTVSINQESKQMTIKIKQALEDTIQGNEAIPTVTNPADRVVVVNKQRALPDNYVPTDLVYPNVNFYQQANSEKKMLRAEAARALEELFAQAKSENVHLQGVSGYRSYQTQKGLFNYYVETQGEEHAKQYSAYPGTSEHQTGLAIDVAGADGRNLLEESFADTKEGQWLASNVSTFGFIIRYPKGKEQITGYAYEPWHLRYVGKAVAEEIATKGITLEEYFQDAVPVSAKQP